MSIPVHCSKCGSQHSVHDRLAGREIRCPDCDAPIEVPEVSSTVSASADDPAGDRWLSDEDTSEPTEWDGEEAVIVEAVPVATPTDAVVAVAQPAAAVLAADSEDWIEDPFEDEHGYVDDDDDADFGAMVTARQPREEEELDMTPMVDVTFLLLIFFMVTASFTLQRSIQMPRQTSDLPSNTTTPEPTEEMDTVELEIDEFGGFLAISPDRETECPGKQSLINTLDEMVAENGGQMTLSIKVHEMAKLQSLVDGMDSGTIAGFSSINVTQVDGFD